MTNSWPAVNPIRTILVPTEFSPGSQAAEAYATFLAKTFGARIVAVHVIEAFAFMMTESLQVIDVYQRVRSAVEPVLDDLVQQWEREGIAATSMLVEGKAYQEILAQAKTHAADLIVMGSHGRGGVLSRAVLGSVAERVTRMAPCPVLVVPAPEPAVAAAA